MSDKFKGSAALLIAAIVWGSGFVAQKLGGEAMPPMTFNATRQLMAAIVLLPLAVLIVRKNGYFSEACNTASQVKSRKKKMLAATAVCGGFLLLGSDLQQLGLATVSVGKSGFISTTYVVFVPIVGALLGEKVRKKAAICAVLALIGFAVMSLRFDGGMTKGDWQTLASAVLFAVQILAVNHYVDDGNSILLTVVQLAFCGVFGLVIGILAEHPSPDQFRAAVPILIYTTLVPTVIGYSGQVIGQRYTDSSTAALLLSLESIFAVIFGALILGELMSAREIAGSVIIFTAVIIAQLDIKRKE